ncbi:MAG TPA: AmmeMemoRadiSam system protein B [Gammaproteobacteria bacterium]|nr:AmmeMemoRadiSam system protein B [Gammaproteobacteria bacterium]
MESVRQPNVAGLFYPSDPSVLAANVKNLLDAAPNKQVPAPKAIIAPHAGYIYSGPIAASIYKTLLPHKDTIKRVVLLGPAHRVGFLGIAVTQVENFATPLGLVPVDAPSIASVVTLPGVKVFEHAYDMEHCLEVQLPFLQTILSDFSLVPCVVGDANPADVANLLQHLWGGPETLIVISSDLSHYYDYATAQKLDQATTQAILNLDPNAIADNQACGRLPVKGLLLAASNMNLHAQVLDLRNSGDTAGDKSRVVGYGAYHFI